MNGASAEPCAKTRSPPTLSRTRMIGRSHHFFRTLMKAQSSLSRLTRISSELASQVTVRAVGRMPHAAPLDTMLDGALTHESHDPAGRGEHDEIYDAHED